jgi:hypothetical protein
MLEGDEQRYETLLRAWYSNRLPRYFVNAHRDRSTIVEEGEKFLDRHAQRLA